MVLISSLAALFVFAGFFQQFGAVKRVRISRNRKVSYTFALHGLW
jgi:hypothetical protein